MTTAPGGEPRDSGAPTPQSFGDAAAQMVNQTEVEASIHEGEPCAPGDEMVNEGAPTESSQLADELRAAQEALTERTADLQRLQAEYVNYKRRVDRDRDLVRENAVFGVLSGLLPVLDDIDRAREHGELEGGFKAVADSLETTVSGLGLTRYAAPGDEFDPVIHEALMHRESPDVETTTVEVVAQAGYRMGERVVRVAKVTVLGPE